MASENLNLAIVCKGKRKYARRLIRLLKGTGRVNRVDVYRPGKDTIKTLTKDKPDVLVMDSDMPKINGVPICNIIRDTPELATLPIVLISGDAHLNDFSLYFKGVDVVKKPVNPDELIAKLNLYKDLDSLESKLKEVLSEAS